MKLTGWCTLANTAHILVVIRRPPFYSSARESIDLALALAAFDLPVSLLFIEQGVWCLQPQAATAIEHKAIDKMLAALGLYDIEQAFVGQSDLTRAGLDQLTIDATIVDDSQIATLFQQANHIVRL